MLYTWAKGEEEQELKSCGKVKIQKDEREKRKMPGRRDLCIAVKAQVHKRAGQEAEEYPVY